MNTSDPNDPGLRKIRPDGMQESYLVLSDEERTKGFTRPVRKTYRHLLCGTTTVMGEKIAETYARDPKFYSGTFCVHCRQHYELGPPWNPNFIWVIDGEPVGSTELEATEYKKEKTKSI